MPVELLKVGVEKGPSPSAGGCGEHRARNPHAGPARTAHLYSRLDEGEGAATPIPSLTNPSQNMGVEPAQFRSV